MFLPIINLYLFVICGFFKWTDWPNQYWPDPLKTADENKDMPEKWEDTVIQL
jgi:3-oxoacyl-ACP reductase-like protein